MIIQHVRMITVDFCRYDFPCVTQLSPVAAGILSAVGNIVLYCFA